MLAMYSGAVHVRSIVFPVIAPACRSFGANGGKSETLSGARGPACKLFP